MPAGSRAASTSSSATASRRPTAPQHDDNLHPALPRSGVRARRRRHPPARRRRDQARRARDPPQAPRFRPICPARRPDRGRCAGRRRVRAAGRCPAQRDHRPAQLDPLRTCSASRSKPAPKPRSTRSTTMSTCSRSTRTATGCRSTLPIADATVKENARRGLRQSSARRSSPRLRVDGGINYEFSHLTVTGDASADRTLKFLKPNLTLDWKPGGGLAHPIFRPADGRPARFLRFHQRRRPVRPSGSTAAMPSSSRSATWEFRATRRPSAARRRPVQARPRPRPGQHAPGPHPDLRRGQRRTFFDAPGNLGTGKRDFASLTLDAPLGRAVEGLRVKFSGTIQRTRVDDPISRPAAQMQRLLPDWQWDLDVRRDAGKLSYGFDGLTTTSASPSTAPTSSTRTSTAAPTGPRSSNIARGANTAITLDVDNAFDSSGNRDRLLFRPNRAQPDVHLRRDSASAIATRASASR